MIRELLERFSRGTSIKRRLPAQFGNRPVYLSPDSALSYLKPQWAKASQPLLAAAAKYAAGARSVWDVGANCGVFTFAAAHVAAHGAQILAVEPDPFLAALVQRSANENENADRQVNVVCTAVSDQQGLARFLVAQRGRSSNSLEQTGHRSTAGGTRYAQYVPTVTLDMLLQHFASPDLIKIDVEGAEVLVLKGAERILRNARPILYVEVGEKQNAEVSRLLQQFHYRLFDGDASDGVPLNRCAFNTLAVPAESQKTNG